MKQCKQEFRGRRHMFLKQGLDLHTYCVSDHDLWPNDPNFNRGHLLSKANAHVKYQDNRPISCRVIDRKRFISYLLWQSTWPFGLVARISKWVIYWSKVDAHAKYQANRSIRWWVIDRKRFSHLLWQWPWLLT